MENKSKVYIYQEYPGDPRASAIITFIQAKFKTKNVFVLSESFTEKNNLKHLTPTQVPGLELIDEETLSRDEKGALYIDTRKQFSNQSFIRNSVSAPVYNLSSNVRNYSDLTENALAYKFSRPPLQAEISQLKLRYPLASLARLAGNRKIVLYGQDDSDYSPLVFFEAIKDENIRKIYWLRLGERRIAQKIYLGVLPANLLKEKSRLVKKEYVSSGLKGDNSKIKKYILIRTSRNRTRSLERLIEK